MDQRSIDIIITRFAEGAQPGDFIVISVGAAIVQSRRREADGQIEISYLAEYDTPHLRTAAHDAMARFGTPDVDPGGTHTDDRSLILQSEDGDVIRQCLIALIDAVAPGMKRPLQLCDGEGAHMPKRKGLFGLGGWVTVD